MRTSNSTQIKNENNYIIEMCILFDLFVEKQRGQTYIKMRWDIIVMKKTFTTVFNNSTLACRDKYQELVIVQIKEYKK